MHTLLTAKTGHLDLIYYKEGVDSFHLLLHIIRLKGKMCM